jgi:DNA-binding NtrC family response regulator
MPQMSGIDLAIRVKEICPECKVLLFSGQAVTMDLIQAARMSGYEFQILQKPIHPTNLLATVREQQALP